MMQRHSNGEGKRWHLVFEVELCARDLAQFIVLLASSVPDRTADAVRRHRDVFERDWDIGAAREGASAQEKAVLRVAVAAVLQREVQGRNGQVKGEGR
jgi:hypothetical protein